MNIITLSQFLLTHLHGNPNQKELSLLLTDIATISKSIKHIIETAPQQNITGKTGYTNIQHEEVKYLDMYAHETIVSYLKHTNHFSLLTSEEQETSIEMELYGEHAHYIMSFDPLDGSDNTDTGALMGTIFSVKKRNNAIERTNEKQFLSPGRNQLLSGYILYGSSTILVFTFGYGVCICTLDPMTGEFMVVKENHTMPDTSHSITVNYGKQYLFPAQDQRFIKYLTDTLHASTRNYSCMVADIHRIIIKGGIYLYPEMYDNDNKQKGKIRILYESHPLAFIIEQAGGYAHDGTQNILERIPTSLHERSSIYIGSKTITQLYFKHNI